MCVYIFIFIFIFVKCIFIFTHCRPVNIPGVFLHMFHVSPGEAVEQPTQNPQEIIPETVRFIQILKIFWVVVSNFFLFSPQKLGKMNPF